MAAIQPCQECGETKRIEAKGLCRRCYGRLWWRKNSDYQGKVYHYPDQVFVCKGCGKNTKHVGNGLCQKCQTQLNTERLRNNIGVCSSCGETKRIRIRSAGLCSRCYAKTSGQIVQCKDCGQEATHQAKGLCRTCYAKMSEKRRLAKGKRVICEICQEEKVYHAKGLCAQCYRRLHKKQWKKTVVRCAECGNEAEHMAKGLCTKCYLRSVGGQKYRHQRDSRKHGVPATLTHEEWLSILEKFNYSCAYCGDSTAKLAQEHWVPLSRGGGYTAENIVPSCKVCNSRKHTMTGDEFVEVLRKESEYVRAHSSDDGSQCLESGVG